MTVESASYISGLVPAYPPGSDSISEGDDHLRLIKTVLQGTFPNANAAINGIHTGTSAPTSTSAGQLWFDTNLDVLKIRNEADGAWVTLGASPVTDFKIMGSNTVGWIPPTADGSADQYLKTDGSGNLDWATPAGTPSGVIPSGGIIMWSGAVSAIPAGWVICDGNNSTPDLTGKFVIHADADSGGTYDVGDNAALGATGSHTLTTAEMPAHTHSFTGRGFTANNGTGVSNDYGDFAAGTTTVSSTGGGTGHSHTGSLPPYYALAYIMKT